MKSGPLTAEEIEKVSRLCRFYVELAAELGRDGVRPKDYEKIITRARKESKK